jgi:hypothetical protein
MFQTEVKLEFVRRYCSPDEGWQVFVDIDASEEGRTGSEREAVKAKQRQREMLAAGKKVRTVLESLRVKVGGNRKQWFALHDLPSVDGDRDVVAFHQGRHVCVVGEVEGVSGGQPETKLYKAIGQIVVAASGVCAPGWDTVFVLVVHGREIADHLGRVTALTELGVSALSLAHSPQDDDRLFQAALLPKLLSVAG